MLYDGKRSDILYDLENKITLNNPNKIKICNLMI